MIEDIGHQSEGESNPIPLDIKPLVLDKIIEWLKYHFDDPIDENFDDEDINSTKRTDDICEWDQKFFEVDRETLFDLIIAANFLDIKGFKISFYEFFFDKFSVNSKFEKVLKLFD